jgi:hypothetical protein
MVENVLAVVLVRLNMTAMLVMMHVRSHVLRMVLRFVMLRMLDVTAMLHVMLHHFNTP